MALLDEINLFNKLCENREKMSGEREEAEKIIKELRNAGFEAYFAGGAVRDQLMGKVPKDYDIATSATPEEVLTLFPSADAIGKHFGVILVKRGGAHFEVATFRIDGDYKDGRRPESVTFASAEEDAQRRDFTINGMFFDPESGRVVDYVEGEADLKVEKIRAIGDPRKRFEEDALRLMRAIRFAVKTGFEIEEKTLKAIRECAPLLKQVSVERIQEEFSKIISSPRRAEGLQLLVETDLIDQFMPEVRALIGCEQPPQWHPEGDVYIHTRIALSLLEDNAPLPLCLSVLLHDIAKPPTYFFDEEAQRIRFNGHDSLGAEMAREILTRMRYSNAVVDDVETMVAHHMQFMNVKKMRTAKVKRFLSRPTIEEELELHRVDCASSNGFTENYDFLREKQEEFANAPIIPPSLITGQDLIALGYKPGPEFRDILEAVETEQLEGRVETKEDALKFLKQGQISSL